MKLADAPMAVTERRYPQARQQLAEAEGLIAKVKSVVERQELQAELDQVRTLLAPLPSPLPSGSPAPAGSPGSGPDPSPSPSKSPQPELLPPLPTLLPSLPLLS